MAIADNNEEQFGSCNSQPLNPIILSAKHENGSDLSAAASLALSSSVTSVSCCSTRSARLQVLRGVLVYKGVGPLGLHVGWLGRRGRALGFWLCL